LPKLCSIKRVQFYWLTVYRPTCPAQSPRSVAPPEISSCRGTTAALQPLTRHTSWHRDRDRACKPGPFSNPCFRFQSLPPIQHAFFVGTSRRDRQTDIHTDRRTDGRTDRIAISISRVSVLTRDKSSIKLFVKCYKLSVCISLNTTVRPKNKKKTLYAIYLVPLLTYSASIIGVILKCALRVVHGHWKWCHFQWPWTNLNHGFIVTPLFDAKCLTNGYRYGHSYYRRRIGNRIQAFEWHQF